MAAAIIGGLLRQHWTTASIHAVDVLPEARAKLTTDFGITTSEDALTVAAQAQTIVLAVKPQQMHSVTTALRSVINNQLVISIAAGLRGADLQRWLGPNARVVRAMPNTPALIGVGLSGLFAMPGVDSAQKHTAEQILAAVGTTFWVNTEIELDAVTAVSGSGPAYVFYFIEALEQAALELGLSPALARHSALSTFSGAVQLAQSSPDSPAELRARVTSKGGTTERALSILNADHVQATIRRAVQGAAQRAAELGDDLSRP